MKIFGRGGGGVEESEEYVISTCQKLKIKRDPLALNGQSFVIFSLMYNAPNAYSLFLQIYLVENMKEDFIK